ncbi:hypothetical protein FHX42_001203 [Saccharopolyspora lacisalsi]|uniref:Uncharacterized protein n=1 Tax=Halosaccharopolyspora lacisalsi TaxID=1000566 RepID=A0A839DQT3_9PSEU|nr:hypothetical protein [Halosaccharopolyspora lacisalsi]MBA8823874.1 hypothetical protein [Halosaccharopolyspora lacisalsi]
MAAASPRRPQAEQHRREWLHTIAQQLARRQGCSARPVLHVESWLESDPRVRRDEIVVTWTAAEAGLVRWALREQLSPERVFAAAPRVRYGPTAHRPEDIPGPRGGSPPES